MNINDDYILSYFAWKLQLIHINIEERGYWDLDFFDALYFEKCGGEVYRLHSGSYYMELDAELFANVKEMAEQNGVAVWMKR